MKVPYIVGPNGKKYITYLGIIAILKRGGSMKSKTVKPVKAKVAKPSRKFIRNSWGITFHVGDTVALKGNAFKTRDPQPSTFAGKPIAAARIASIVTGTGKDVQLEQKLGGYWTWCVDDLRRVKNAS